MRYQLARRRPAGRVRAAGYPPMRFARRGRVPACPPAAPQTCIRTGRRGSRAMSRIPEFALRQRMQPHRLHSPRHRVRQRRDEEHVALTRQEESARRPRPIHLQLQCRKESGNPLRLIHDDPLGKVGDKAHGIGLGAFPGYRIVEGDVRMAPRAGERPPEVRRSGAQAIRASVALPRWRGP